MYPGGGAPPRWMIEAGIVRALRPRGVLFLCVANSARSAMAEGIARSVVGGGDDPPWIGSAGSAPTQVRPEAVAALAEVGIDIAGHRASSVTEVPSGVADTVITLCADEVCPAWLGDAHRVHWGLPDPAAVEGDRDARMAAFRAARDELRRRIGLLLHGR